jgi:hypothetical protein
MVAELFNQDGQTDMTKLTVSANNLWTCLKICENIHLPHFPVFRSEHVYLQHKIHRCAILLERESHHVSQKEQWELRITYETYYHTRWFSWIWNLWNGGKTRKVKHEFPIFQEQINIFVPTMQQFWALSHYCSVIFKTPWPKGKLYWA